MVVPAGIFITKKFSMNPGYLFNSRTVFSTHIGIVQLHTQNDTLIHVEVVLFFIMIPLAYFLNFSISRTSFFYNPTEPEVINPINEPMVEDFLRRCQQELSSDGILLNELLAIIFCWLSTLLVKSMVMLMLYVGF